MAKRKISPALKWITTEAKKLRRKYPHRFDTWREYVAQASAIYASKHKGRSPVGKKKKVSGRKPAKAPYRQTGASNRKRDEERTAYAPGKRILNKGKRSQHAYYERRKNRSDVPGQLTGTSSMNYVILQHLSSANTRLKDAEAQLLRLKNHLATVGRDKSARVQTKRAMTQQRKLIATIKKDIRGYKLLLR